MRATLARLTPRQKALAAGAVAVAVYVLLRQRQAAPAGAPDLDTAGTPYDIAPGSSWGDPLAAPASNQPLVLHPQPGDVIFPVGDGDPILVPYPDAADPPTQDPNAPIIVGPQTPGTIIYPPGGGDPYIVPEPPATPAATRPARPGNAPKNIPAWAWVRLRGHLGDADAQAEYKRLQERGKAPKTAPKWWWAWAAWRKALAAGGFEDLFPASQGGSGGASATSVSMSAPGGALLAAAARAVGAGAATAQAGPLPTTTISGGVIDGQPQPEAALVPA